MHAFLHTVHTVHTYILYTHINHHYYLIRGQIPFFAISYKSHIADDVPNGMRAGGTNFPMTFGTS